jgi:predicted PurR-regulated permease PerM
MATTASVRPRPPYLNILEGLVLIVAVLYLAKQIIIPLALAILLTFVLTPVVVVVQRRGLKRVYAVLVVVCLTFAVLGAVGWGVGYQVQRLAQDLPTHTDKIKEKIARLRASGGVVVPNLLRMIDEISKGAPAAASALGAEDQQPVKAGETKVADSGKDRQVIVAQTEKSSAFEQLSKVVGSVLEPLATAGLVLILVIYMLIKREDLRNRLIGLLGYGHVTGTTRVFVDAAQRLSSFLLTQLLINASFGLVFGVGLYFLQVPYAFLWGFLTAALRFVPYIGSWIAVAFPLILSFATSSGWAQPLLVLAVFAVLDVVTANVIEPLLFGHTTGVTPIALLIAAAFWTWVWGPIGLVLSTPLTVCLVVLGQHVPRLKFLALLLGNEPALRPHASYYQRLLARDREEAKEVVEQYVREHGLEKVYDNVLLPCLVLARRDRKRNGLTVDEEEFIYQTTQAILDRLPEQAATGPDDGHTADAKESSPGLTEAPVAGAAQPCSQVLILGCPAHHEAEELSLHMLAQLLQPAGCRVEVISTRALPSEAENRIEQEEPTLVFIAVLPPGGLVQARYLCKRLRTRFVDLKIVVGYWGETRSFDKLLVRLRSAGAAYVATSLLQSRSQIQALVSAAAPRAARPTLQPTGGR